MSAFEMPKMNIAHQACFHDNVQIKKTGESYEIVHELKCSCDLTPKPATQKMAGDNGLGDFLFGPRQCNYHIVITQYKQATCKRQDCLQHLIAKRIINQCNYQNPFSMKKDLEKLKDKLSDWTILDLSKCVHPIPALEIKKDTFRNTPANQRSQYSSHAREEPMKEKSSYPSELPPSYDSVFGNYVDKGSDKKQKQPEKEKASSTEAWLYATANCKLCNNDVQTKNRCSFAYAKDGTSKQVWDGWIFNN